MANETEETTKSRIGAARFCAFVDGISALTTDAKIESDGIALRTTSLTPNGVSLVSAVAPLHGRGTKFVTGADFDKLAKLLPDDYEQPFELSVVDDQLLVTGSNLKLKLAHDYVGKSDKEPSVEGMTKVKCDGAAFAKRLAYFERISPYVTLELTAGNPNIDILGHGDIGNAQRGLPLAAAADASVHGTFNIEYLLNMVKLAASHQVGIELSLKSDDPCCIAYEIEGVSFRYWLAPYTES